MPVTVKGRKKESRRDGPNIQLCRSRLQIEASRRDESIRRTWRPIPRYGLDTGHGLVHPSYRAALDIRWGRQKFRPCALTSSQPTCGEFKTDFFQALHPGYHRPLTAIYGSERGVAPSVDGVRFVPWSPPASGSNDTYLFVPAKSGGFWINDNRGLIHIRGNRIVSHINLEASPGRLMEEEDGSLWVTTRYRQGSPGSLCHATEREVRCFGKADGNPIQTALPILSDGTGGFWIGSDMIRKEISGPPLRTASTVSKSRGLRPTLRRRGLDRMRQSDRSQAAPESEDLRGPIVS